MNFFSTKVHLDVLPLPSNPHIPLSTGHENVLSNDW